MFSEEKRNNQAYYQDELRKCYKFLTIPTVDYLISKNILSVGELFDFGDRLDFRNQFNITSNAGANLFYELSGLIRVLRCQYFNEDPKIDVTQSLDFVAHKLGLSKRLYHALKLGGIHTGRDLFQLLNCEDLSKKLDSMRNIGKLGRDELLFKVIPIKEYYENKVVENLPIEVLQAELKDLLLQQEQLLGKITAVKEKIAIKSAQEKRNAR